MRVPFDSMIRWWGKENGHSRLNGSNRILELAEQTPADPPWLAQLDKQRIPRTLHYPDTTLGRIIDQAAERFGSAGALIYNQETCTYRELLARVNRLAGGLAKIGVRKGDRVLLALPNCPEFVLAFFAAQKLGAVVVNAGPLMGVDDLKHVMEMTTPRVVVGLDLLGRKVLEAAHDNPPEQFVWVSLQMYQDLFHRMGYQLKLWQNREWSNGFHTPVKHTTLSKVMENAPSRPPTVEPSAKTVALLQPTSGTTGAVKLVELTHANLLANATQVLAWMGVRDGQESVLSVLPMFHVYGLMMGLISPICCCASMIVMTRFDTEEVMHHLLHDKPSIVPLVPAICDSINNHLDKSEEKPVISSVRYCMTGAAPLPKEIAERFEKLTGIRVIEGYGLTESSPVTHANLPDAPRYGTIGLPMPDTLCQIVDLDDPARRVPAGQAGELIVSGPQVMSGYYRNPEATRRALWTDPQGRVWLRTGDIGRMDEEGFFQIMDRKKDMIIRSGLKVYPAKIEKVLATHPRVADVAVIGQADAVHTEEVVAVIVLKPGEEDEALLTGQLRALCRQHLAPYEVPQRFVFKNQIPRSALGKLLKTALRAELAHNGVYNNGQATPPAPVNEFTDKEAA